jgi:hypothetical protein
METAPTLVGVTQRVQKMIRINVDPEAWTALRVEALRHNTTLANTIGKLVEAEASRLRGVKEGSKPADLPGQPTGGNSTSHPLEGTVPAQAEESDLAVPDEEDWSSFRTDRAPGDRWIPPWEE